MKDKLAKTIEIFSKIDIDIFYCVTIYEGSIAIQGKYNPATIRELGKIGFTASSFSIQDKGEYIVASLDNINVTLTE
jgi:hypothetical protein